MSADVVNILYSCIEEIGMEKIKMDITSDIASSKRYSDEIIAKCKSKLGAYANDTEVLGTLCEAILHFMLTASLLPSERKVSVRGVGLDIVIPSVKSLDKQPEKTLVIQVMKKSEDIAKIKQSKLVQPHHNNIWIVSPKPLKTNHRIYSLDSIDSTYNTIIQDISKFLVDRGVRGLKLLHGQ